MIAEHPQEEQNLKFDAQVVVNVAIMPISLDRKKKAFNSCLEQHAGPDNDFNSKVCY